ncbi:SulP family inorganic anion transporter [Pseudomonas aeruginosa]|uniref:SulP family inorganic anion transporter n=1 Tax=Pseudomonas aeruginosa TaxID=287 RepID=UPI000F548308|nr:SulP family inorganic anion transporter [Pseudomonas aeruginosa]EKV4570177.1 SulP family inorganic anion transporter [Pseudomonas aeruginosa]MCV4360443.1 SulP family inorganic anion transporter [Pseudomonas aeruginosa]MCW3881937.1 SulP family inorganic anion transporter [Pseudomonas aeruginosa]RQH89445.1 SulP family inorganic anion transporter [Pseudomonas aeruginosa]RUA96942.1 SulP family inorganic anion transporter [Pseudomonas aeruginosa]
MHVSKVFPSLRDTLPRDLMASVVVFLVALPLCMGIAIASGMPPAKGLLTGIVGGLVVGFLAGSPLQVSGPAAGLAVLVFELVRTYGVAMLGPILLLAGAIQLLAGRLRLGCWFRVTSPAVVYGMLAGIGILIVLSQLHVMLDLAPKASGLDNLLAFPQAAFAALGSLGMGSGLDAALLGLGTIAVMWGWDKLRPQRLRFLPGALLGVSLATLASLWLALDVRRVEVPANLGEAIDWLRPADLLALADPSLLLAAVVVAFIASAETLLSAAAVDRLHDGPRSDMDRELSAQGVGNMLCGLLGALPMTGVIVRSSANVNAGARTRASAIFHGLWLLAFVLLLGSLLRQIPVASLAGVLVYTGVKLVDFKALGNLSRYGRMPMLVYAATALTIVFTDLLTGVLVGFALTLLKLVLKAARLKIALRYTGEHEAELRLSGAATFLKVPALSRVLDEVKPGTTLHVPMDNLSYVDHACMELLEDWGRMAPVQGSRLVIEPRALKRRLEGRLRGSVGLGGARNGGAVSPG